VSLMPFIRAAKLELILTRTRADDYLTAGEEAPARKHSSIILGCDGVDGSVGYRHQGLHSPQEVVVLEE
jgi:hypothetical protein